MLAKLLKHDFKSTYKLQSGLYTVLFMTSIISMILKILLENNPGNIAMSFVSTLTGGIAIFTRLVVVVVTMIYAVWRYRKNILKDEGYLMNTLPVKKSELLASKIIVPYCWLLVDALVIYLSVSLEAREFVKLDITTDGMFGDSAGFVVLFIAVMLVSFFSMLCSFYFCLNIGYSRPKDRDLFSFIAYIGLYIVNQVISSICLLVGLGGNFADYVAANTVPTEVFTHVMLTLLIMSVAICAVYFAGSVFLLNKKISLE